MANLIDAAEFTANEVYEIAQTDPVEGAAAGASFGGIGVSNEPHQQLANRTAFLKQRQDTNIASIGALQAFQALFKGLIGGNGYAAIPFLDVSRGLITAYVQWGAYSIGVDLASDTAYTLAWPVPFPNACMFALATAANPNADKKYGQAQIEVVSYNSIQGTFFVDYIGGSTGADLKMPGFYWLAIGF